jgi:hypothetical protein
MGSCGLHNCLFYRSQQIFEINEIDENTSTLSCIDALNNCEVRVHEQALCVDVFFVCCVKPASHEAGLPEHEWEYHNEQYA